jgi:hypothetical protein
VRDEQRLLSAINEEAQGARRCVEICLQHHRRSVLKRLPFAQTLASVVDCSPRAVKTSNKDERKREDSKRITERVGD